MLPGPARAAPDLVTLPAHRVVTTRLLRECRRGGVGPGRRSAGPSQGLGRLRVRGEAHSGSGTGDATSLRSSPNTHMKRIWFKNEPLSWSNGLQFWNLRLRSARGKHKVSSQQLEAAALPSLGYGGLASPSEGRGAAPPWGEGPGFCFRLHLQEEEWRWLAHPLDRPRSEHLGALPGPHVPH